MRTSDERPVVVQFSREAEPSAAMRARYEREFEILRDSDCAGVARVLGIDNDRSQPILVFEDAGAQCSLDGLITEKRRDPARSFFSARDQSRRGPRRTAPVRCDPQGTAALQRTHPPGWQRTADGISSRDPARGRAGVLGRQRGQRGNAAFHVSRTKRSHEPLGRLPHRPVLTWCRFLPDVDGETAFAGHRPRGLVARARCWPRRCRSAQSHRRYPSPLRRS